jgi:hypothetical protein
LAQKRPTSMRNEDGVNEFDYTSLEQFLNWEFDQSK